MKNSLQSLKKKRGNLKRRNNQEIIKKSDEKTSDFQTVDKTAMVLSTVFFFGAGELVSLIVVTVKINP